MITLAIQHHYIMIGTMSRMYPNIPLTRRVIYASLMHWYAGTLGLSTGVITVLGTTV